MTAVSLTLLRFFYLVGLAGGEQQLVGLRLLLQFINGGGGGGRWAVGASNAYFSDVG
jgi:hypothetical protein